MKTDTILLILLAVGGFFLFQRQQENAQLAKVDVNQKMQPPSLDGLIADSWNPDAFNGVTLDHIEQTEQAMDQGSYDPFYTNYDGQRYGFDAYHADPDPFNLGLEVKP